MPEPFVSGYYPNPGNASAGFNMPYQTNFQQQPPPAWSTGTSTQPPPAGFGYGDVNLAAPQATVENQQYVTADHLFSQNNASAYPNTFSTPYLNGGMPGNWSYFNNPNSFFFPTGNGDLNLSWGAAAPGGGADNTAAANAAAFLQDIYKPPLPAQELENIESPCSTSELSASFENGDVGHTGVSNESMEHALSNLSMNNDGSDVIETLVQPNSDQAILNSVTQAPVNSVEPAASVQAPPPSNAPAKPVSWAAVASQPAKKPNPPKKSSNGQKASDNPSAGNTKVNFSPPSSNGGASGSRDIAKGGTKPNMGQQSGRWANGRQGGGGGNNEVARDNDSHLDINHLKDNSPLLRKLMVKYNFNPREFNVTMTACRFFIIKSYSEDDIFRSIKYSSWTSTEHGNRRLNDTYRETQRSTRGPMYLLFSVNSSGHFCGVAQMMSEVDLTTETGIWVQDKWKGRFDVRWMYVKDVPNNSLRHIRLENNENKPVTNSRDTQEVPHDKGKQILKIIHNYKAATSIFDDFSHYEKRQEEDAKMRSKKMPEPDL